MGAAFVAGFASGFGGAAAGAGAAAAWGAFTATLIKSILVDVRLARIAELRSRAERKAS